MTSTGLFLPIGHTPLPGFKVDRHVELMRSACDLNGDDPNVMVGLRVEEAHKV